MNPLHTFFPETDGLSEALQRQSRAIAGDRNAALLQALVAEPADWDAKRGFERGNHPATVGYMAHFITESDCRQTKPASAFVVGVGHKLKKWLCVTDAPYGAVADGATVGGGTNNSAAIQAAIDAVVATGTPGTVHIPPGIYRCDTGLILDLSLCGIEADGAILDFTNMPGGTIAGSDATAVSQLAVADPAASGAALIGVKQEERWHTEPPTVAGVYEVRVKDARGDDLACGASSTAHWDLRGLKIAYAEAAGSNPATQTTLRSRLSY